jgi:hypothetical protein
MKWFATGIIGLSVSIGAYIGVQKHDFIISSLVGLVAGLLIVGLARILLSVMGKFGTKYIQFLPDGVTTKSSVTFANKQTSTLFPLRLISPRSLSA